MSNEYANTDQEVFPIHCPEAFERCITILWQMAMQGTCGIGFGLMPEARVQRLTVSPRRQRQHGWCRWTLRFPGVVEDLIYCGICRTSLRGFTQCITPEWNCEQHLPMYFSTIAPPPVKVNPPAGPLLRPAGGARVKRRWFTPLTEGRLSAACHVGQYYRDFFAARYVA